jgi:hypothetical protein
MARLYADENFAFPVVVELRLLGHDVVTAQEAGQGNQEVPDDDVLTFAVAQGRTVLTFNRRHFVRLHLRGVPHTGIVVCTADEDTVGLATRIHEALARRTVLENHVIRVTRPHRP